MKATLVKTMAGALAVTVLAASMASAQDQSPQPPPPQGPAPQVQAPPTQIPPPDQSAQQYTPGQLEQLLAPIALYPDPLLAQILMAATYPLDVVQADRWLQAPNNAPLKGNALTAALAQQPWDPSVKSLAAFPQILRMMDDKLDWTEQLGDAFLANQAAVMDSVQRLRQRAQAAGKLRSTPQETVTADGSAIEIEPPTPETVYVPVYEPAVVYGDWPWPLYPPFYFPGFFDGVFIGGFGFGWFGYPIIGPLWGWGNWDWGHRWINIDRGRWSGLNNGHPMAPGGGGWQHDVYHRRGVPYQGAATQARFGAAERSAEARRTSRGYPATGAAPTSSGRQPQSQPYVARPAAPQTTRATPASRVPPSFESYGRGADVRAQANRGYSSRMSTPSYHSGGSAPSSSGNRGGRR